MRVLQINCSSNGSTGNIAKLIHKELIKSGEESFFAYGMGPDAGENTFRISDQFDYHVHTYMGRLTGMHGYFSVVKTNVLVNRIKQIDPDIVHLHNLHGDYVNIPILMRFLKKTCIQIVITLHDCWLFTGGCAHYTVADCDRWTKECGSCRQLNVYPKSYIFDNSRWSLRKKKEMFGGCSRVCITTVSNWLNAQASQSYLNQYPIQTIYNGIDTGVFHQYEGFAIRGKYGIPNDKKIILGVASVWNDERKGLGRFIEISRRLPPEYRIVLVGLTKTECKQTASSVIGIERTENQEELGQLYSTADVLVNLSPEETFGMVSAEALACGTPSVVSRKTACPEVIDNNTGIAVDTSRISEVIDAAERVIECSRSVRCRERAVRYFDSSRMINGYIELYEKINNRGRVLDENSN